MASNTQQDQSAAGLLLLPPELLHKIWGELGTRDAGAPRNRHQLALRSTCSALVHASNAWITALEITVAAQHMQSEEAALQQAAMQLSSFPAASQLQALLLDNSGGTPILSSFLFRSSTRLAAVQTMRLDGHAAEALSCGDMFSVAAACPLLQTLLLGGTSIAGPVFLPLAGLPRLGFLRLADISVHRRSPCIGESLAHLSHLTQLLTFVDSGDELNEHMLQWTDVLPNVSGLRNLRDLTLDLSRTGPFDAAILQHLSTLADLTSLTVWYPHFSDVSGADLFPLSSLLLLTSVTLQNAILDTAAVRLLCALPRLSELLVANVALGSDLSGTVCALRKLIVEHSPSMEALPWLPLQHPDAKLHAQGNIIDWTLGAASSSSSSSPDALFSTLHKAAQLLARVWGPEHLIVHLCFNEPPAGTLERPAEGGVGSAGLLAALAPLHGLQGLSLCLGPGWQVSGDHVRQLAAHLPSLRVLAVDVAAGPEFVAFAAAAASGLPLLRALKVARMADSQAQLALLSMACVRARARQPLAVYVQTGLGDEECESCNRVVQMQWAGDAVCFYAKWTDWLACTRVNNFQV